MACRNWSVVTFMFFLPAYLYNATQYKKKRSSSSLCLRFLLFVSNLDWLCSHIDDWGDTNSSGKWGSSSIDFFFRMVEIGSSSSLVVILKGVRMLLYAVCIRSISLLFLGLDKLGEELLLKWLECLLLSVYISCYRSAMVFSYLVMRQLPNLSCSEWTV